IHWLKAVTPTKARVQVTTWIPAFAGMTVRNVVLLSSRVSCYVAAGQIGQYSMIRSAYVGRWRWSDKTAMLLAFGGVSVTLIEGQVNAMFLLAFSLALLALKRDRLITGGALLGVLWLKPQYAAPFALLLLVKCRWRELAGMVGVGAGIGALSFAMVGPEGILEYLKELQRIGAFRPPADALVSPQAMVNWRAMLLNLWPDVPDGAGSVLVLLLGGATIIAALLNCRGEWAPGSPLFARQMLVMTLATILASPHSHFHGAVLLLAPLAALLARSPAEAAPVRGWRMLLVGGLVLSIVAWPVGRGRWVMAPYYLVCLGMLICCRPPTLSMVRGDRMARSGD
ncbi:MAG TPA: glycosyltransferase family 87 protein, partial [Chloroflexota bacterium]|nr:glycosyltransferase family 87 protein [Chloroflexota bacterium]